MNKKLCLFMTLLIIFTSIYPFNITTIFAETVAGTDIVNNGDMEGVGTDNIPYWWFSRGSGTIASVLDEMHGGSKSLKVTGRTQNWEGPAQNLSGNQKGGTVPGKTYHAAAWVKYTGETAPESVQFVLGVQWNDGTGDGTPQKTGDRYDNIKYINVTKGQWTMIDGDYTGPTGADLSKGIMLYVQTTEAGPTYVDFCVDDVSMVELNQTTPTQAATPPPTTLPTQTATPTPVIVAGTDIVNNGDMEGVGTDNVPYWWFGRGSGTIASALDEIHGGSKSLKVTGRTQNWEGPAQNLSGNQKGGTVPGKTYHAAAWVKYTGETAPESVQFVLGVQWNDGTGDGTPQKTGDRYDNIKYINVTKGQWTMIDGDYTGPTGADLSKGIMLYVQTTEAGPTYVDFCVDDVSLVELNQATPTQTPTPSITGTATPTPGSTFHCFLLLGQSNMAGFPAAQESDKVEDPRIRVLGYDNNPALGRVTDQWDVAAPPLHESWNGAIGPGDWFAKTMIKKYPASDTIGLIPCAISGEKIETFMKVGGTKYSWIIERAKLAQQAGGVIDGIIFHQGESNNGDPAWPEKVKTLVGDLRTDLNLGKVPFIAGELLYSGDCASHNTLVNQLPSLITNCHVVSAQGLVEDPSDTTYNLHFDHDSQVALGKRYAEKMGQALGVTGPKLIALTFDDGPDKTLTPLVLDKLDAYNVPATFMMVGKNINAETSTVVTRIVNSGHEIANHSWDYTAMTGMSASDIEKSINDTNAAILQYSGTTPKFFRPPSLATNDTMFDVINLTFAGGITANDWDQSTTAEQRANAIISQARDGAIILLHDVQPLPHPTPEVLDILIPYLINQGYEFVTLSELFSRKGSVLNPNDKTMYVNVSDEPSITPANGFDFEGSTQGWQPKGTGVQISPVTETANKGSYSLKITGCTEESNGASFDAKSVLQKGAVYQISGYVKLANMPAAPSNFKISAEQQAGGSTTTKSIITRYISDTNWTKLSGTYTFTQDMENLTIYVGNSGVTDQFYFDNFSISMISPPPPSASTPTPAPTPVANITYDFENTVSGWTGRGAAQVSSSSESKNTGSYSLKVTGRTSGWHGPSISVKNILQKGATYQISGFVKRTQAVSSSTIKLSMAATPVGGSETYPGIGSISVSDTQWQQISGTYTFTQDMQSLVLYFESSDAEEEFYIDSVNINMTSPPPSSTPVPTPTPDNSGIISDFETNTNQGWVPRIGGEVLTVSDTVSHSGSYSLFTTNRKNTYDAPKINVTSKMYKDSKYNFSVWVKLKEGETSAKLALSLQRDLGGSPSYETIVSGTTVTADSWVRLTGNYTVSNDFDALSVYIESSYNDPSGATKSYYIDDFTLTYIEPPTIQSNLTSVKDVYNTDFKIGAALMASETKGVISNLMQKHFNSVVADNEMKPESIQRNKDDFNWVEADRIVQFTEDNGMDLRFHTLVWHQQTPDWWFRDDNGNDMSLETDPVKRAANKALLLKRLDTYIRTVVDRYGSVVDSWDVVNEVIDQDRPDGMRNSKWYNITGKDFIKQAFISTRSELDKNGWTGKLYINDYNTNDPKKRDWLYNLIVELKNQGVPIDGVGHQTHINIYQPSVDYMIDSIKKFGELGLDNQITELDVSIYNNNDKSKYETIPESILIHQGYRYKELFEAFKSVKQYISNVTLWGISDEHTWLSTFPIARLEAPLLFDSKYQAKYAYWGIVDPDQLPALIQNLKSSKGTPVIDGNTEHVWSISSFTPVMDSSAFKGYFKTLWDDQNLYILAEVSDSQINSNDKVEVFVEDANYVFTRDSTGEGAQYTVKEITAGYRIEAVIPLSTAVLHDVKNYDIRFTDNDTGAVLSWNDKSNSQNTDTSKFGNLTLCESIYVANAVNGTPNIDGTMDTMWNSADEITTDKWVVGSSGSKAKVRTMWDSEKLYVYAHVTDSKLVKNDDNAYNQDSVEIFIDQYMDRSNGYGGDDAHYYVNYANVQDFGSNGNESKIQSVTRTVYASDNITEIGYVVEAAIDLDYIQPQAGKLIGFDVHVNNDEDGDGKRDSAASWNDSTNMTYIDTRGFGTLMLATAIKTALAAKITEAQGLSSSAYTSASWSAMQSKLTDAIAVNLNANATQNQVDTAFAQLQAAINGLSNYQPPVVISTATPSPTATSTPSPSPTPTPTPNPTKTPGPLATSTPEKTPVPTPEGVKIPIKPVVDAERKIVSTTVDLNTLNQALEKAKEDNNGVKKLVIEVEKVEGAEKYTQELPLQALSAEKIEKKIEIKTPVAEIVIPGNMMSNSKQENKNVNNVALAVAKADTSQLNEEIKKIVGNRPVIELNAKVGNNPISWNNPDAPVTVSIDYEPTTEELRNLEHIVVRYIDPAGKIINIPSGKYDAASGKVTFTTTHFSKYAIAFEKKTFSDIGKHSWAKKQIEVLSSKGVIDGTSEKLNTFEPSGNITRADFICLLVRTLGLNARVDSNFTDVVEGKYYYQDIGIAKKLGITNGSGDNKFKPDEQITRQDMMVLIVKGLKAAGKNLPEADEAVISSFSDASEISVYAVQSVAVLVKEGMIKGSANMITPAQKTTRAEVAVIMYSVYNR
ncbi:carbohydrate binding domain-containing protein [Pseudobacteroides cellulosolvens]|uniref:Beta-xylanase n=3 Tax=Pseudobacteroides cellulosolvens TaxID=35825 RepID=A0A0L6JRZ7_9FIRM|nr:carbohydrate binding domain-containing protein [Pseudobacteroides cellulosolvens]KNY28475.1 glycoside hydrolase family 10 [Pseudobacteroides cellulosolvens ATCC 35603 = DSM 2933]